MYFSNPRTAAHTSGLLYTLTMIIILFALLFGLLVVLPTVEFNNGAFSVLGGVYESCIVPALGCS